MSPPSVLKEAFGHLRPIEWSSMDTSNLKPYLKEAFESAELITNSVPMPPSSDGPSASSNPQKATKAADTFVNPDNLPLADSGQEDLHKAWGKPVKLSQKDNPLGVSVYKMSSPDGNGAFFARKSVHQGIPFPKFKRAMEREFVESLKVHEGPGSGAIRGISGDQRIESEVSQGMGKVEVWQLSSVFPGPVTPREFWSMIVTSDSALSDASAVNSKVPRHYIVISRPVDHPDLSPRSELVKGQYESIELIREVLQNGEGSDNNPVEWIMVTRSDPGGGIPRFMVERGTPGGIVGDVSKFLDWAITKGGDLPDQDSKKVDKEVKQESDKPAQAPVPQQPQADTGYANTEHVSKEHHAYTEHANTQQGYGQVQQGQWKSPHVQQPVQQPHVEDTDGGVGGLLATIAGAVATTAVAVGSTVSEYVPTVSEYIPYFQQEHDSESESSFDSSDDDHYSTADESTDPIARTRVKSRVISSPMATTTPVRYVPGPFVAPTNTHPVVAPTNIHPVAPTNIHPVVAPTNIHPVVAPTNIHPNTHSTTSLSNNYSTNSLPNNNNYSTTSLSSTSTPAPAVSHTSRASTSIPPSANSIPSAAAVTQQLTHPTNSSERDLLKHSQKRVALDEKYAQKTADLDVRAQQIAAIQNGSERAKATERHDKDARKAQDKYEKAVRKTEEKRVKNAHKVEEKRRAAVEKDNTVVGVAPNNREALDWRTRCLHAEREVEALRRQVEGLQSQIAASGVVAGSAVHNGAAGMPVNMRVG